MGWCETDFEVSIAGTALALGGFGQMLVAIIEVIRGSSFSFAVFGSYGAFWVGWALVFFESKRIDSEFGTADYRDGKTLWFTQWGILTFCFWVITWRKNLALITVFFFLWMTFFLLAVANAEDSEEIRKTAGYFGFVTALGAFYTGVAELVNEEWGRHILPGLRPVYRPQQVAITAESLANLIEHDARTNTLLLQFRGLQVLCSESVKAIEEAVELAILAAKTPDNRVHVVADYANCYIAEDVMDEYWKMAMDLQAKYYLSATRFHVSSFGTASEPPSTVRRK
jgi:succinate-acetate transporter protein